MTVIDDVLSIADTHSTLIQDGFESQFFLNESGVDFGNLGSMLFAQTSFYHLWAGFENAAFLGYYQYDINIDDRYSLSWQSNENYSCPDLNISTSCRELFTADRKTGRKDYSIGGASYDCRARAWYSDTKYYVAKRWTSLYIDRAAGKPAFALCAPLVNLTTKSTDFSMDENGLVGVACTGVFIEALSSVILDSFTDLGGSNPTGLGAFIVDRASGLLVSAGTSNQGQYFNDETMTQILASESTNNLIRFASRVISNYSSTWPSDYTTVAWVRDNSTEYPTLNYEAYYISTLVLTVPGLVWDLVVIQEVDCPVNYYVDVDTLVCTECISPRFTSGVDLLPVMLVLLDTTSTKTMNVKSVLMVPPVMMLMLLFQLWILIVVIGV